MKILVIDDEADQAGINTANINNSTIRTINRLIRDLVNGKNEKSQEISNKIYGNELYWMYSNAIC